MRCLLDREIDGSFYIKFRGLNGSGDNDNILGLFLSGKIGALK